MATPSTNGRDGHGRFTKGNAGGPGNPLAPAVARLRIAMLEAVSAEDIEAIIRRLVEDAKQGDHQAAKEVLSRCLGKPEALDLVERLERLEDALSAAQDRGAA